MSQTFFQTNIVFGIFVFLAMAICSPISACAALAGSIISMLTAVALGMDAENLYQGSWAFSAIMTSITLGGMFFVLNSKKSIIFAILGTMLTVITQSAVDSFFTSMGIPALTFSF